MAAGSDGWRQAQGCYRFNEMPFAASLVILTIADSCFSCLCLPCTAPGSFAVLAAKCIHIYDLAVKQPIVRPVLQLPFSDTGTAGGGSVNCLAFNTHIPNMLTAAANDVISVWELPQRLVEPRQGEQKLLKRLLDSEDATALLRVQGIVAA